MTTPQSDASAIPPEQEAGGKMSFFEHLVDLRKRHLDDKLIYTSPAGLINIIITFGIYIGVVLAAPFVLYQVWLFIAPGLYKHERRAVTTFIVASLFLFLG